MSFAVSDDPAAPLYQVFHQTPSSTALSFWKDVNIRKSKVFKQVDQHIFVFDDDMSRNTFALKSSDNIFEEVKVSRMTEMKQNFHEKIRLVWFADSRVRVYVRCGVSQDCVVPGIGSGHCVGAESFQVQGARHQWQGVGAHHG